MRLGVNALQLGDAVVGVVLRRFQRRMSHQLLNVAHVGIAVEQMRGERVAQDVGASAPLHVGLAQLRIDDSPYRRTRQRQPLLRQNQRRYAVNYYARIAPRFEIILDSPPDFGQNGDYALLVSLAAYFQR